MQNFSSYCLVENLYLCLLLNPYSIEKDYLPTFIWVLFEIKYYVIFTFIAVQFSF